MGFNVVHIPLQLNTLCLWTMKTFGQEVVGLLFKTASLVLVAFCKKYQTC